MSNTANALLMLAAGIGIPVLAALNAALGQRLGSPAAAASILFTVAFAIAALATAITGPRALAGAIGAPPHLFFAGCFVAFYVLSITWVAPHFGVGNAVFFVLLGQLVSSALIDQFGMFGAPQQSLTLSRIAGLGLMTVGVGLARLG